MHLIAYYKKLSVPQRSSKFIFFLSLAMTSPKPYSLLPFLFFLCLNTSISFASDHISFDNSLSGNKTISSQVGKFVLGFFKLGNNSMSPNYYLGIWYKKVSQFTPVWIANRNAPISDPNTTELTILTTGNMALLDHNKTHIWSTNVTSLSSNFTICTLLDTGNLVLKCRDYFTKVLVVEDVRGRGEVQAKAQCTTGNMIVGVTR